MQTLLLEHMPRDLAQLVVSYVQVFMHPIIPGYCPVCQIPMSEDKKICEAHEVCIICLEIRKTHFQCVCIECSQRYHTATWIREMIYALDDNPYLELFRDNEFPIDIPKVSIIAEDLTRKVKKVKYAYDVMFTGNWESVNIDKEGYRKLLERTINRMDAIRRQVHPTLRKMLIR